MFLKHKRFVFLSECVLCSRASNASLYGWC